MMSRWLRVSGCIFAAGLVISGQSVSPVQLQTHSGVSGGQELALTNVGSGIVTALALGGTLAGTSVGSPRLGIWKPYDAATEPLAMAPLFPNQPVVLPAPAKDVSNFSVLAVVFADGTTWGDPASAARLLHRRVYMQKYLTAAIADLRSAAGLVTTVSDAALRSQLLQEFGSAMAQELAGSANADESACVRSVRGLAIANLQHVLLRADGSPVPTAEVISHELAAFLSRLSKVADGGI